MSGRLASMRPAAALPKARIVEKTLGVVQSSAPEELNDVLV